jgi:hypothetical protein
MNRNNRQNRGRPPVNTEFDLQVSGLVGAETGANSYLEILIKEAARARHAKTARPKRQVRPNFEMTFDA